MNTGRKKKRGKIIEDVSIKDIVSLLSNQNDLEGSVCLISCQISHGAK